MNIEDDFGFTFADSETFERPYKADANAKVKKMYEAIMPLLENLKKNPNSDIIKWPNRVEKVDAFIEKLNKILEE